MKYKKIVRTIAISSLLFIMTPGFSLAQGITSIFDDLSVFTDNLIIQETAQKQESRPVSLLLDEDAQVELGIELQQDPQMILINKLLLEQLGKPYRYGASGPDEFDCSGLVYYIYGLAGKNISRTSQQQGAGGVYVDKESLKFGDLVFFDTRNTEDLKDIKIDTGDTLNLFVGDPKNDESPKEEFKPKVITHCGVYVGGGNFIHASSGNVMKVVIEKLDSKYFAQRYVWAKRY